MTLFIIAASVLALSSLAFVLRPLWQGRRVAGLALTLSLAVVAGLLYTQVGTPRALDFVQRSEPATLEDAIAQLRERLVQQPDQVEGWRLLGRALTAQGQVVQARDAYAKAAALAPQEPDVLTEAAEARALAAPDRRFDDSAVALLRQALAKQPMHQRARWFLGIAQRQAQQPAEAARTWEPLLAIVDSKTAVGLREQIDLARAEAGMEPLPAPVASTAASSASLTVKVALDPSLKLPPGATLFVIARQAGGPPMPVAAKKIVTPVFPLEVVLDDADSLMPTAKLSSLQKVELLARLSASGDATPQRGDLESSAMTVRFPGDAPVELVIDRVRP
jgi:cytochrome c-type biogenesis protein CcmH